MSKRKSSNSHEESPSKLKKVEVDLEDKLRFCKSPKSLLDLSAFTVALSVWYHHNGKSSRQHHIFANYDSNEYDYESGNDDDFLESYDDDYEYQFVEEDEEIDDDAYESDISSRCEDAIKELPVSEKELQIISKCFDHIEAEIDVWTNYFNKRIFFPHGASNLANDMIDELKWSNGRIDYVASAKNLLLSPRLSDIHKFRVMCTYCIEDEIKKVSRLLITEKYMDNVNTVTHPLIYYWTCFLRGELKEIHAREFPSFESYLVTLINVDNWIAIEYFFKRLDYDDQVAKAIHLLTRRPSGIKYLINVFSILTSDQQHAVVEECAKQILYEIVRNRAYEEYVSTVWNYCKNFVDEATFAKTMNYLLDNEAYSNLNRISYKSATALELWTDAPIELKRYVLEKHHSMFRIFFQNEFYPCKIKVLMKMLVEASVNVKMIVFNEYIPSKFYGELLKTTEPRYLNEFLKLRFSDTELVEFKTKLMNTDEIVNFCVLLIIKGDASRFNDIVTMHLPVTDIVAFKIRIMNMPGIKSHCMKFINDEKFDELNNFLATYLPDSDIERYQLTLLNSNEFIDASINRICNNEIQKVTRSIKELLSKSKTPTVDDFKKRILFSPQVYGEFYRQLRNGEFVKIKELFEEIYDNTELQEEVKNKLFNDLRTSVVSGECTTFKEIHFENFLMWCLDDEEISSFKNSLPLDFIFKKLLTNSIFERFDTSLRNCSFKSECNFEEIDYFLEWYFSTEKEIKQFKMTKIFLFRENEIITTLLRKTDRSYLKALLKWFFDDDQEQIRKFKETNSRYKIANYI